MPESYGIHWFRRDLRVAGNPALKANFQRNQGRVVGLFTFDSRFLARPDFSASRFQFFLHSLRELKNELNAIGSDLLVVDGQPYEVMERLLEYWLHRRIPLPALWSFNRDYEPFARARDERVLGLLKQRGAPVHTAADHLLLEPHQVTKGDGGFYQVFTPFSRRWKERLHDSEVQQRIAAQDVGFKFLNNPRSLFALKWSELKTSDFPFSDALEEFIAKNQRQVSVPLPKAGSHEALAQLDRFSDHLEDYADLRDFPSKERTSKLSVYLKNGSLTSVQIIARFRLHQRKSKAAETFLKELIWREFYYHVLYHRPDVETQSFLPQFRTLAWTNNEEHFRRWQEGLTGFPIVDAGMRQLAQTGWMHNRVRMIVASFLTKDLLIDWRWGERHFMRTLLDGDLAPNNGGWQWAASTGCDAQPYFRIFNPSMQGKRFDPNCEYIKAFVPELRDVAPEAIHDPLRESTGTKYPAPMVDHRDQVKKALKLYKV